MKLFKPEWVSHDGKPIFSIDFHVDGNRFATGGLSSNNTVGLINIWNVDPLHSYSQEMDSKVHKLLCTMDNHLGCVNCVRFSHDGKFLASCSDDRLVMIWKQSNMVSKCSQNLTNNKNIVEEWKCCHILRSHQGDVLHISWSPNDLYLASCSVDNSVIVWNTQKFPEIIHTLNGHHGIVKGVTWDPIGTFMASQSDDKSIILWRADSWKIEQKITKPFLECSGTTHILRLDWSPDGKFLVSAHAMNNGGPVAQIINRDNWLTKTDFVGHRKAITIVKFNKKMFFKSPNRKYPLSLDNVNCCLALGSRDRSISIWISGFNRPIVVIHDLFNNSVMDISWSSDGYSLIVSSFDGSIAYISFSEQELGHCLSDTEKKTLMESVYGHSLITPKQKTINMNLPIAESSDMLKKIQLQKTEQPEQKSVKFFDRLKQKIVTKQYEVKTKDGKRRIKPVSIIENTAIDNIVFKHSDSPVTNNIMQNIPKDNTNARKNKLKFHIYDLEKIAKNTNTSKLDVKKVNTSHELTSDDSKCKLKKRSSIQLDSADSIAVDMNSSHDVVCSLPAKEDCDIQNETAFLSAVIDALSTVLDEFNFFVSEKCYLKCVNKSVSNKCRIALITLFENSTEKFQIFLPKPILTLSITSFVLCTICNDQSIHLFHPKSGFKILPTLTAKHKISRLKTLNEFVLVLTVKFYVHVWNVKTKKSILSVCGHYLSLEKKFVDIFLTETGLPILVFSKSTVYVYNFDLLT
ncbi:hypothetical protein A3Q56_02964 [Intoshia linei]|uniref:Protein HIRA n=1 Tax=Intoshia linei TaxID=1819745 RepID=A0A177B6Q3_9BILA|nr:hypothetical protein A3Q56_02964 [Intoshia linei]